MSHVSPDSTLLAEKYFPIRLDPELLSPSGRIILDTEVEQLAPDEDAKHVINRTNARKAVYKMWTVTEQFAYESHFGFKAVLDRNKLGLVLSD